VIGKCPSDNFFDCGNARCIAIFWRCDGEDDCGNWADEQGCDDNSYGSHPVFNCPPTHVHCNGSLNTCIPYKWICDGTKDCESGSDESNCFPNTTICHGFLCKNFQCIPTGWRCNSVYDCWDESDEHNCSLSKENCDKQNRFDQCINGECITYDKVCDNHRDCPQGDDEGMKCSIGTNSNSGTFCIKLHILPNFLKNSLTSLLLLIIIFF
jgi:hypothetical protein